MENQTEQTQQTEPVMPVLPAVDQVVQTVRKNTLTQQDVLAWAKETLIFTMPAFIAAGIAFQGSWDYRIAFGAFYSAILTSLINLYGKYKQGV